jgi:hypothetical protein
MHQHNYFADPPPLRFNDGYENPNELSVKSLKDGQHREFDPFVRNLFIKSLFAHRVSKPTLKARLNFWDLFFLLLKL